jgi:3-keto steroid reductase
LAICRRLVDEFLSTRPATESFHLIFTTRDSRKSAATVASLHRHLNRIPPKSRQRIFFHPEHVDLTSLSSVNALAQRLLASDVPKLDAIILNAAYGGLTGLNWPLAVWSTIKNPIMAFTYPPYKLSAIGYTTHPQTRGKPPPTTVSPIPDDNSQTPHPPLGAVFCANVFGHYLLAHFLMPLLVNASPHRGRIIWISTLEAYARSFSTADLQGLVSPQAYESSKRLTDILALTSTLPSTQPFVSRFSSPAHKSSRCTAAGNPPNNYLAHPGICSTSFVPLPLILFYCMTMGFYLARWLGSPWHTVEPYLGACAPVWLALAPQDELDMMEGHDRQRKAKWGSSADRRGRESVRRTEVEGYTGLRDGNGDGSGKEEISAEFEELGRTCWMQMEALREEWEKRLGFSGHD